MKDRTNYYLGRLINRTNRQRDDIDSIRNDIDAIKHRTLLIWNELPNLESTIDLTIEADVLPSLESSKPHSNENELSQIQTLSEQYHCLDTFAFKYNAITVSVNKESIDHNRGNEDKAIIIFEETNRGNYWLFEIDDITYLVPTDKYINQHSYTNTNLSFDCHGYNPGYDKIQLQKPAIVTLEPHSNQKTWRLRERGEIVFL